MRPVVTIVVLAILAVAATFTAARLTGRTWDGVLADIPAAIREIATTTVRQPATPAGRPGAGPPPMVSISQPVRREIVEWDETIGRFEAMESVELRSRVSGYLQAVRFQDGQEVRIGDVLFEIDPRPAERALAQAAAELDLARTRIANAALDVERARPLVERRIVSEKTFDDRENLQREAAAQAKVAEARVANAELDLSFTRITAPIDGRIGRALVTPGNFIAQSGSNAAASSLATIVRLDPIFIYFDITEIDALKLKRMALRAGAGPLAGDPAPAAAVRATAVPATSAALATALKGARVEIRLADETAYTHAGTVDFLDNRLDAGTGSLRARAVLDNPTRLFTPGQFARVRLSGSSPTLATLVPDTAIGSDQANRFVLVVGPDEVATRRPVTLGPLVDGLRVVREGLGPDDWVVTRGLTRVRPGQKIVPKREPLQVSGAPPTPVAPVTR